MTIKECKYKINKLQNDIDYLLSINDTGGEVSRLTKERDILLNWLEREIENIKTKEYQAFVANEYNKRDTVSIPYIYTMDTTVADTVSNTLYINNNIQAKLH